MPADAIVAAEGEELVLLAGHEVGDRLAGRLRDRAERVEVGRRRAPLPPRDGDRLDAHLGRKVLLLPAEVAAGGTDAIAEVAVGRHARSIRNEAGQD